MEKLFISRQSRHLEFDVVICKVLFLICTLTWRVDNYVSRQGKSINRKNESTDDYNFYYYSVVLTILTSIVTFVVKGL